jgi:ABC-type glycerol-3-phosphate transport system permease component
VSFFPLFWMISTSLKPTSEVFSAPLVWWPSSPTLGAYVDVATKLSFPLYFRNTLVVSLLSTVVSMVFAIMAAYGFSRYRFRGRGVALMFILGTQMFPLILLIIPYFTIMQRLGLVNTDVALLIAYSSFSLPFCTWVLIGFFDTIPRELDEAALVDGCTRLGALFRVVLRVALPGLGATSVFAFMNSWNQYLFPLVITTSWRKYTLPLAIASLMGQTRFEWNDLMAASVLAALPPLVLFLFFQKYFIYGLAAGSVKE